MKIMNEKTRKGLYTASDLLWRGGIWTGKVAFVLCLFAVIPSLALDIDDKRKRNARNNSKKH